MGLLINRKNRKIIKFSFMDVGENIAENFYHTFALIKAHFIIHIK